MSIELYYVNHLRLVAKYHHWVRIEDAAIALDAAMKASNAQRIEQALARLKHNLFTDPPNGPHQALRQAQENYTVLSRFDLAGQLYTAAA